MGELAAAKGGKSSGPALGPARFETAAKTVKVLVADDADAARRLMALLLESLGCGTDEVGDGVEAVEHASRQHYDAVFMDIDMPGLDGIGAALAIRRLGGASASVPIIALSGFTLDLASRPELALAFDRTLAKPIRRSELEGVVAAIAEGAVRGIGKHPEAANPGAVMPAIDADRQELIFAGLDPSLRRGLLRLAVTDLSGLALELDRAVPETAHLEIAHLAHKIRGTAVNFGATRLSLLAAGLETACERCMPDDIDDRIAALGLAAAAAIAALRAQARLRSSSRSCPKAKARG